MRLEKGGLFARVASGPDDLERAQELRHFCFLTARGLCRPGGRDVDGFDADCQHVLIEEAASGRLLACFRVQILQSARMCSGYAGQFYDLRRFAERPGMTLELGRFCVNPASDNPEVLRLAWAAITRMVDDNGIWLLFGCTSFPGADLTQHQEAFAHLRQNHLAPDALRPERKAVGSLSFPEIPTDPRRALSAMPPLLRSYLAMGGWVSDHAVIDTELDTLHVFTGLEVARIPAVRARALRALAE